MKNNHSAFPIAFLAIFLFSCSIEEPSEPAGSIIPDIPYIIATLQDDVLTEGPETKTMFQYSNKKLKASWSEGDEIAISPKLYDYINAGTYRVTDPEKGVFERSKSVGASADKYGVFYPASKIKSTAQYTRFHYEGQVQRADDPQGHMGAYHSMRTQTSDYSSISFSGAKQSSCMRFCLSGMEFDCPFRIELQSIGGSRFYLNNVVSEQFTYYDIDTPESAVMTKSLSLELEGYGKTDKLEAWMMMSDNDVNLVAGDIIRVIVYCKEKAYCSDISISSNLTLTGGHCHNLTISKNWKERLGDYTKYDWDGEVVTLQEGIEGLDLVIMGDGFIKEDFDNGTYEAIMRQAYEEFFSIEPYTSLRNAFSVYYVKVPSPERTQATTTGANGASNNGHDTRLSCTFTPNSTTISGDHDLAVSYALAALGANANERIQDATIVVMANQECRAGTCYTSWYSGNGQDYGKASAIAYCALGTSANERIELMHHEICGHGFGKLADEYYYSSSSLNISLFSELEQYHAMGLYRNVDLYIDDYLYTALSGTYPLTTSENVYWHDLFGTANSYEQTEGLGIFKGGYTYSFGFCRPTEDGNRSVMNANRGIFNAISRRQIYYRYRRLCGELSSNCYGSAEELASFLEWDATTIMPKIVSTSSSRLDAENPSADTGSGSSSGTGSASGEGTGSASGKGVLQTKLPLPSPVLRSGYWQDGRFIAVQ